MRSRLERAARVRRVPAARADLGPQPGPGVLSVPAGPPAPDRGPGIGCGKPLTQRRAEPPTTASAHKSCGSRPGLWAEAGAPPAPGRRLEAGRTRCPPGEVRKGPAAAPPGAAARAPAKCTLHPGFVRAQRARQRRRSSRPGALPAGLTPSSQPALESGRAPSGTTAEGRRPPAAFRLDRQALGGAKVEAEPGQRPCWFVSCLRLRPVLLTWLPRLLRETAVPSRTHFID